MDGSQFDALTRSLTESRRSLLAGALALAGGWFGAKSTDARKRRKHRKKHNPKARPNAYGCLEVGDSCRSAEQCCSGVCDGKQGQRKCRAHDTGICKEDAPGFCELENQQPAFCEDFDCACFRTTAGSSVCARSTHCAECQRDADCTASGYPLGSACIPMGGAFACEGLCESGMACAVPCSAIVPEP